MNYYKTKQIKKKNMKAHYNKNNRKNMNETTKMFYKL